MTFFRSLHFKLAATVISVILVSAIVHFTLDYRSKREQILSDLDQRSVGLADVALKAVLQMAMLGQHTRYISGILEDLTKRSEIAAVHVLDKRGSVKFSSDPHSIGWQFSPEDQSCTGCHDLAQVPDSLSFLVRAPETGPEVLRHVSALPNAERCHNCHGAESKLNGLLITDFRLGETRSELERLAVETLTDATLQTLCMLLIFAVFMHHFVITPVQSLAHNAREIGKGDFLVRSNIKSSDEIGLLARELDRMAYSLGHYKQEVEEKGKTLKSLVARLVNAQEKERRSLSLELHDQLGQSMSALLMKLQSHTSHSDQDHRIRIEVADRVREQIEEVRRLARGLHPSILEDLGLNVAIRQHLADLSAHSGIQYHYEFQEPPGLSRLSQTSELALYRIAQEALTNIVKHAKATHVSLVILRSANETRMIVEDDGCGFDTHQAERMAGGSLGMVGMRERAGMIGGNCVIESSPGMGTMVLVILPHHQESGI